MKSQAVVADTLIEDLNALFLRIEGKMQNRTWKIVPKTTMGQWSIGLIVAMPVLFFVGSSLTSSLYKTIPAGHTILADIVARPALALTMLAGMAAGISAFFTGLLATVMQRERALLVYASTMIGALLILFLVGEIVFPH